MDFWFRFSCRGCLAISFGRIPTRWVATSSDSGEFWLARVLAGSCFAWWGELTQRLLQTSINALPRCQTRPSVGACQAVRCPGAKCSQELQRGVETHTDPHQPIQKFWLTPRVGRPVLPRVSSYYSVVGAVQLTMKCQLVSTGSIVSSRLVDRKTRGRRQSKRLSLVVAG